MGLKKPGVLIISALTFEDKGTWHGHVVLKREGSKQEETVLPERRYHMSRDALIADLDRDIAVAQAVLKRFDVKSQVIHV